MRANRLTRTAPWLVGLLACCIVLVQLRKPMNDPDFFWHLKTGEWIAEHRSLPPADPFAYTSSSAPGTMQRFTLTSYWAAQLLYHLLHRAGGMEAIIVLRFILALLLIGTLFLRREGDALLFVSLVAVFASVLRAFTLDRPQTFSLVYFSLLLLLLGSVRRAQGNATRRLLPVLPALMALWANTHGAYLLGQGTIVAFLAAESLRRLHPALRPLPQGDYLRLLAAGVAGLAASVLNPNTWHALGYLHAPGAATSFIDEYASSWSLFSRIGTLSLPAFWLLLALCLAGVLLRWRETGPGEVAVLAVLGWFALFHVRYIPFFAVAAIPVVSGLLSRTRASRWVAALAVCMALASGGVDSWRERHLLLPRAGGWVNEGIFPARAADFLGTVPAAGNLYNHYSWGGYLIWRLAPGRKVFMDGRNLDDTAALLAQALSRPVLDEIDGRPTWKLVFERYRIGVAVIPLFTQSGLAHPLMEALLNDPGWEAVHLDPVSIVLARNDPANAPLVRAHAIPKVKVMEYLIRLNG